MKLLAKIIKSLLGIVKPEIKNAAKKSAHKKCISVKSPTRNFKARKTGLV